MWISGIKVFAERYNGNNKNINDTFSFLVEEKQDWAAVKKRFQDFDRLVFPKERMWGKTSRRKSRGI